MPGQRHSVCEATLQVGSDARVRSRTRSQAQKIPPLLSWRGRPADEPGSDDRRGRSAGSTSADETACADAHVPRSRAMQLGSIPLEASGTGGLDLSRIVFKLDNSRHGGLRFGPPDRASVLFLRPVSGTRVSPNPIWWMTDVRFRAAPSLSAWTHKQQPVYFCLAFYLEADAFVFLLFIFYFLFSLYLFYFLYVTPSCQPRSAC